MTLLCACLASNGYSVAAETNESGLQTELENATASNNITEKQPKELQAAVESESSSIADLTEPVDKKDNKVEDTLSSLPLLEQAKIIHNQDDMIKDHPKLDGRGVLIASIDSGIDLEHEALSMDDNIDKNNIKEKNIGSGGNIKVPYIFDAMSGDDSIKDDQTEHGMHIAGILVGNSKKTDFKGVAKNAQLLAYRTWSKSDAESYQGSNQFFAMEDAMNRKADVISLSIGEVGTGQKDDIWAKVLERARKEDVIIAAAMGNYGTSSMTNSFDTLVDEKFPQKDASTLLSVSSNENVIGVGAYYDTHMFLPHLQINGLDIPYENINWQNYFHFNQEKKEQISFENTIIDCDQDKDTSKYHGKILLVKRVSEQVYDQLATLMKYKPQGIILINSATPTTYGNYKTIPEIRSTLLGDTGGLFKATWAISISEQDGYRVRSYLKDKLNSKVKLNLERDPKSTKVFEHRGISGFSTWGPTPTLELKPDLVAPGENIYSTGNEGGYFNESGTSMAAPHVAGASALLLPVTKELKEKWNKQFPSISLIQLNKLLFQNTADILEDYTIPEDGKRLPYSPRRQGAGAINLIKAAKNKVFVSTDNHKGAILLKDFVEKEKQFSVVMRNLSNTEKLFKVEASPILGQKTYSNYRQHFDQTNKINSVHAVQIDGSSLSFPSYIRVPANSELTIPLTLHIGSLQMDQFVEGFISFKSLDKNQPDLNIPYLGFYGDWNKEKIVDPVSWQDGSKTKMTGIVTAYPTGLDVFDYVPWGVDYQKWKADNNYLDADPRYYVMQSQGGIDNHSKMKLRLIFMRHAKDFQVEITDSKDEKQAKTLKILKNGHYYPKYMESAYHEYPDRYKLMFGDYDLDLEWDGSVYNPKNNEEVPLKEGTYYIKVKARLEESRPWQVTYIPFTIDNTPPEVSIIDRNSKEITITVKDKHLKSVSLVKENKVIKQLDPDKDGNYHMSISDNYQNQDIRLRVEDFGENKGEFEFDDLLKGVVKDKISHFSLNSTISDKNRWSKTQIASSSSQLGHNLLVNSEETTDSFSENDDVDDLDQSEDNPQEFISGTDFHDGKVTSSYTEATTSNKVNIETDENGNSYRPYFVHLQKGQYLIMTNTNALQNAKQGNELFQPSWQEKFEYNESDYKESHFKKIKVPMYQGSNILNVKVYFADKIIFNKGFAVKLDTKFPELTINNQNIRYFNKDGLNAEVTNDQVIGEISIPNNTLRLAGEIKDGQDGWRLFINGDMVDSTIKDGEYDDYFHQNNKSWYYEKTVEDGDYVKVTIIDYVKNNKSFLFKVKCNVKDSVDGLAKLPVLNSDQKVRDHLTETNKANASLKIPKELSNFNGQGITNPEQLIRELSKLLPDYGIEILNMTKGNKNNSQYSAIIQIQKGASSHHHHLTWNEKVDKSNLQKIILKTATGYDDEKVLNEKTKNYQPLLPLSDKVENKSFNLINAKEKKNVMDKSILPQTSDCHSKSEFLLMILIAACGILWKGDKTRKNKTSNSQRNN
nr:S8 family serine peptidase [Streptococcus catagoni]